MFQSVEFIGNFINKQTDILYNKYNIIDSNFTTIIQVIGYTPSAIAKISSGSILEYETRNYTHQEIIKNLFLLNLFLIKSNKYVYTDMCTAVSQQNKYIDKYFPEINFNEKYYDDLISYINKIGILL